MTEGLKWTVNEVPKSDDKHLELMSEENVKKANEFHRSFPQYSVTPLQNLSSLAKYLGVKNIFCKDESYRFGLNAFKGEQGATMDIGPLMAMACVTILPVLLLYLFFQKYFVEGMSSGGLKG